MVRYIIIFCVSAVFAVPVFGYSTETGRNLFVIVTTDDPVTQLMSMVLATQAEQQGAGVAILLCGEAGSLAVSGAPEVLLKPNNKSPRMLLKGLIDRGITVEICPPYLPNNEKTAADLIDGVSVAKPPLVAERLLGENTTVLSY